MIGAPGRLVLLGHPVDQSLSPTFQNAALRAAAIPLSYEALDVPPAELAVAFDALIRVRSAGNVTIPHKRAVAARCDHRTAIAERVGAVNTFWVDAEMALHGDNTDVGGFLVALDAIAPERAADDPIVVLGAGGAAGAVLAALEMRGARAVHVQARDAARASELGARFPAVTSFGEHGAEALRAARLVINATPIGMRDDAHPADLSLLHRDATIIDLVYRRGETSWVREARRRGHRAIDGTTMLIEQGALAFERWFGVAPDRGVMRRALP